MIIVSPKLRFIFNPVCSVYYEGWAGLCVTSPQRRLVVGSAHGFSEREARPRGTDPQKNLQISSRSPDLPTAGWDGAAADLGGRAPLFLLSARAGQALNPGQDVFPPVEEDPQRGR